MKIETLKTGVKLVKRYRQGHCFACVWAADTTDRQIQHDMAMGDAKFFSFNETNGEFMWGCLTARRPIHFRR